MEDLRDRDEIVSCSVSSYDSNGYEGNNDSSYSYSSTGSGAKSHSVSKGSTRNSSHPSMVVDLSDTGGSTHHGIAAARSRHHNSGTNSNSKAVKQYQNYGYRPPLDKQNRGNNDSDSSYSTTPSTIPLPPLPPPDEDNTDHEIPSYESKQRQVANNDSKTDRQEKVLDNGSIVIDDRKRNIKSVELDVDLGEDARGSLLVTSDGDPEVFLIVRNDLCSESIYSLFRSWHSNFCGSTIYQWKYTSQHSSPMFLKSL